MKRLQLRKISVLLITLLMLVSCEDFLDRYPTTAVSEDDIFTSIKTAEASLIGLYNNLQSGNLTGRSTLLRGDLKSCDFMLLTGTGLYFGVEYNYRDNVTTYGSAGVIWAKGYETVKDCNIFIEGISLLEGDQDKINDMIAQAKTIKAIAYLEMVKTFCYPPRFGSMDAKYALGLPLVRDKRENVDAIATGPLRASLTETMEYVEELLEDAALNINQLRQPGPFISKPAVYGILARVKLYQEKWQEAVSAGQIAAVAGSVIDHDDYLEAIRQDYNAECLFELSFSETDNLADRMPGYVINQTVNENNRNDNTSKGYGEIGATDTFLQLLKENPNDIRIQLLHEDKMSTAPADAEELIHGVNGYSERYYYKHIGGKGGNVHLHNIPYIRIPEVLLIIAEAYSEMPGHDADALNYLNQVYSKRTGTILSELSGDELKTAIFNERRRELALEGHGIWDFLRKNRSFTRDISNVAIITVDPSTSEGRNAEDFHKVVSPIPITEMDANPNIRDQQNPGYAQYHGMK